MIRSPALRANRIQDYVYDIWTSIPEMNPPLLLPPWLAPRLCRPKVLPAKTLQGTNDPCPGPCPLCIRACARPPLRRKSISLPGRQCPRQKNSAGRGVRASALRSCFRRASAGLQTHSEVLSAQNVYDIHDAPPAAPPSAHPRGLRPPVRRDQKHVSVSAALQHFEGASAPEAQGALLAPFGVEKRASSPAKPTQKMRAQARRRGQVFTAGTACAAGKPATQQYRGACSRSTDLGYAPNALTGAPR